MIMGSGAAVKTNNKRFLSCFFILLHASVYIQSSFPIDSATGNLRAACSQTNILMCGVWPLLALPEATRYRPPSLLLHLD